MARPSKPVSVIQMEKRSHRTKAELTKRKEAEERLLSGTELKERKEVRDNKDAHKEFMRVKKLLKNIEKNDALYESVINRYAMIQAECKDFEEKREKFYQQMSELEENRDRMMEEEGLMLREYFKMLNNMQCQIINLDKQVQAKRKMLLDIEKENVMTIAASLRSVPKQESKEEEPLLRILKGG